MWKISIGGRGSPELSESEAELRDLAALRDAVADAITRYVHTFITYEGMSWSQAVQVLAMTPEAAKRLYERNPSV